MTAKNTTRKQLRKIIRVSFVGLCLAFSQPALANLTYTFDYDLSGFTTGSAGELSFTVPTFITSTTFVPAIYQNDLSGHPLLGINFRNQFDLVDGSPLGPNPVLDLILDGFSIGALIGGPVDHYDTFHLITGSDTLTLTTSPSADGNIKYQIFYDFFQTLTNTEILGNLSFIVPDFIKTSRSLFPIFHTDTANDPLEYFGLRNVGNPAYNGAPLLDSVAIDLVLAGFSIGTGFVGPFDHTGTFEAANLGGDTEVLTISRTPEPILEPSSLATLVAGLLGLTALARRQRQHDRPSKDLSKELMTETPSHS